MPEEHVTDFERDLAALLAVDPSPAFDAGVRGRVASAQSRGIRTAWMWMAAAATIALAVAAIAFATRTRAPHPEVIATTVTPPTVAPPSVALPAAMPPRLPERVPQPERITARRPAPREPEVIVDPELGRAVRRLFRLVQTKQADAALATVAATTVTDPPQDLGVPPVVVEDLPVKSIVGGERR